MTALRALPAIAPSALWRSPWPLLWLAVAYCTFSTRDLEIGPIPGKFLVTGLALGLWVWYRRSRAVPWQVPLLAFGLALPAFGFLVAAGRDLLGDNAQQLGLRAAAEEASRFVYLMLAIPLMDWASTQARPRSASLVWLVPAAGLAVLTWGLYVADLAGLLDGPNGLGPLAGDISREPLSGTFRAFMVTDIMFIPAFVLLFARLHSNPRRATDVSLAIVLFGGVFLSHTRGIWLGLIVGCASAMLLRWLIEHPRARRTLPLVGAGLVAALFALTVPTAVRPITDAFTGGATEESANVRLVQTRKLLDGVSDHPMLGSGLGAVLPSGYRRSATTPWSFELTYLQLVFQSGLVGLCLIAWLPVVALRDAIRSLFAGVSDEVAICVIAGVGALVGLLVTCASNPYLTTSAGTLALAVSVTGCAAGLAVPRSAGGELPFPWRCRRAATSPARSGE
jgi:hypothetical protein